MPKGLLLRVGIDLGCGGALGPIFPDGTFEYVPIPESPEFVGARSVRFQDLPARYGGTLAQYVPRRYRESAAHYDPEFETYTYGDPTKNKRAQLLRLESGDFLLFYAGLCPPGSRDKSRLYLIGYFAVTGVYRVEHTEAWPPLASQHLLKNAHLRRSVPDEGLVIVSGDPNSSRLLNRAVAISDHAQYATDEVNRSMGARGSLKRAIGRWVAPECMASLHNWISKEEHTHA